MPLTFQRCLPHTSFLGFVAAYSSNILPSCIEVFALFYSYRDKTYIDHQAVAPSFWFRWWRPGFLIVGMLYDIGMLGYSIYEANVFSILLAVRIAIVLYQLSDQYWMIKHWIPFFVRKEKQRFLIVRFGSTAYAWFLVVGSTSWTGPWKERNEIFSSVYFISIFFIGNVCGFWYVLQGGVDYLIQYRFHCTRNVFGWLGVSGMMIGIVGLSIGDGGSNMLDKTLNYHSAFVMIYAYVELMVVVIVHRFIIIYEEESWKYQNLLPENPISSPSMLVSNKTTTFEGTNGFVSVSNKVACDVDVASSLVEFSTAQNNPKETVVSVAAPPESHLNKGMNDVQIPIQGERSMVMEEDGKEEAAEEVEVPPSIIVSNNEQTCDVHIHSLSIPKEVIVSTPSDHHIHKIANGTEPSQKEEWMTERDGKEGDADVEVAAHVSKTLIDAPLVVANPSVPAPLLRTSSSAVFYQAHRRFALAFDGITRRASILRSNIVTHEIMMVKLKRHELVCREFDKLYCIVYQMLLWETIMWLAQIFLTLYLRSVNTPFPPGQNDYYCQTPLENGINSAQFVNDFVFARRRR